MRIPSIVAVGRPGQEAAPELVGADEQLRQVDELLEEFDDLGLRGRRGVPRHVLPPHGALARELGDEFVGAGVAPAVAANLVEDDLAHAVDHAEVGEAGRGEELREGELSGESAVDGEEGQGDGAGDVAAVGVDLGVELLERARAVGRAELQHVIHAVDDLVEHEEDLGVDEGEAFEGAFDSGLAAAKGEEGLCGAQGGVGLSIRVLKPGNVCGGVNVDLDALLDARGDASLHLVDLFKSCSERFHEACASFDWK